MEKEQLALQALEMYPNKVRFVYHHYPHPESEFALKIAEALEASGEQKKFWEMHDRIISGVPEDMSELRALAEEVGLSMNEFNTAIDSGEYTEVVKEAVAMAKEHSVDYVALFINEKKYTGAPGILDQLIRAINEELARIAANGE